MTTLTRIVWLVMLFASLTGCQGPTVSPEQRTSTAEAEAVAHHIATLGSIAATETAVQAAASPVPTATATITPTPDPFPTPVIGAIYVAEQRFEGGWMLWLQPNAQIWVLTADFSGNNIWTVYNDTLSMARSNSIRSWSRRQIVISLSAALASCGGKTLKYGRQWVGLWTSKWGTQRGTSTARVVM